MPTVSLPQPRSLGSLKTSDISPVVSGRPQPFPINPVLHLWPLPETSDLCYSRSFSGSLLFFFSCYFWFIKLFIHPFNQLSIVWFIHSCIHLSIYLSICHPASIHPPTHPSIHPFIHSYIYSPIQQVFIEHLLCGGPLQNTRDKMGRKYIHMASALMQFMIWQIAGAWCVHVSVCVYWRQIEVLI